MKKTIFCSIALLFTILHSQGFNKTFTFDKDVFGTRAFIENKGQFNSSIGTGEKVLYAFDTESEHVFFTENGLIHKLIKRFPLTEEKMEEREKGKKMNLKPDQINYVKMIWKGANKNLKVIESERQSYYVTYGGSEFNSYAFKKITYKNVYDNIDIEYTIPESKGYGLKYNVILHPGADPNQINIVYSGDVNKILLKNGEVIIRTPQEDIVEHTPLSFYQDKRQIISEFTLDDKTISFNFPSGYQNNKTVIIDPWVTTTPQLTTNNYAYDVDYDNYGNLYVFGGRAYAKVAKYDASGVFQWVFSGSIPLLPWNTDGNITGYPGNFVVNRNTGKTYVGTGWSVVGNLGTRIVRLNAAGNYDNFITTQYQPWNELCDMAIDYNNGNTYGFGGGTGGNIQGGIIDPVTATVSLGNFTGLAGLGQDIICHALDNNSDIYAVYASASPNVNRLFKINQTFNGNIWMVPTTYNVFGEATEKLAYVGGSVGGSGYNALAVNAGYLFMYDGFNLAAYNKSNGTKIAYTTVPTHIALRQGGIAVDDCNKIYIGGNGDIKCYSFDGVAFSVLPNIPLGVATPNQYVYDIKLDRNSATLYVCGSGFAGKYNATASYSCGAVTQLAANSNCVDNNNGTAVASVTTNVLNPLVSYTWTGIGGTVSVTNNSPLLTNTVTNLPNGTYTVQMQVNPPNGPVMYNTITINCCAIPYAVNPIVNQVSCVNAVNSVSLNVVGAGTVTPSFTWNPVPGALAGNSLSATGLPVGTTTISALTGPGCILTITVNMLPSPPQITFTINNLSDSYSITCANPSVNLQAVSGYTYGTLNYLWVSPSFTANTSTVSISNPGTITLTVTDPVTGCFAQQTLAIGINTAMPVNSVNPASQAVSCISGPPITFTGTAISPTVNVQHDWYSPSNPLPAGVPIATSNNSISILNGSIPPGIYTLQTTDLVNGCKAFKTVTVTSLDAWPTFSISSPTNFSIGCSPLNQTTISIINPVSTQTPPSVCSYTFLAPSFTGVVTPSIILGGNTSTVTNIPGTWTVIVQDNSNNCRAQLSIPIIQNTIAPHVAASLFTSTLTCYDPTVLATGTSTTPNTTISWQVPSVPPLLSTSTVEIGIPANGPNTSTTSLTYANYTVIATNSVNACQSTSVVNINQNFKPPISSPTISIGTPTAIYCTSSSNPVILTTGGSTTTSGGGPLAFPVPVLWEGPSPQAPLSGVSSYSCYLPGIYTLTIRDNYNGCTKTGTVNILDRTQPPVLTNPADTSILDCGANQATLKVLLTGTVSGLKYWYFAYPQGAAFSPTNAITPDGSDPFLSGTNSSSVNVSLQGSYQYIVTNTLTGCRAIGSFFVKSGGINADFTPEPIEGYAPLLVTFTNTSSTSLGSASLTSVWSFGNGTSKLSNNNATANAVYEAPGNYTVMLIVSKGSCLDTAYRNIKVEIPSKLEVPNIFTPNGDGSNDVFFLNTANISEVTAVIMDRWGNKVYETTSSTGNIAWDGKNLFGKDCAAGVYFYVISGKGKDDKEYKAKGNVSLYR